MQTMSYKQLEISIIEAHAPHPDMFKKKDK